MSVRRGNASIELMLEKFDLFAAAPGAVLRFRELILELAVIGNLVEQRQEEGDGHSLLRQIHQVNPASVTGPDSKQADIKWNDLPRSWAPATLGDVTDIIRGVTFPGSAKSTTRTSGHVACLRTASVQAEIDWDDLIFISPDHVGRSDQWIAPNDIMISMANSYALVGKVAIVRQIPQKATFGAFLAAIRPILINPYFLLYVLRSPRMQIAFRESSSQTTNIANISLSRMRPMPFPLPSLAEQKRIVAKVDELMAVCDCLEVQLRERDTRHSALAHAALARFAAAPTLENLQYLFHPAYDIAPDDLRSLILTLATTGSLVQFDHANDATVGDCVDFINGYAFKSEWFCSSNGIRLVRNQNVGHGALDWCETEYLPENMAGEFARFALVPGDLVLSLNRPFISTGLKLAWIREADCPCLLVQRVACLRPNPTLMRARYLYLWCNAPAFYQEAHIVPSSGVPYIATNKVAQMKMRIPSLEVQDCVITTVDRLMSLVDRYESQLATARDAATRLLDALVADLTGTVRRTAAAPAAPASDGTAGGFQPDETTTLSEHADAAPDSVTESPPPNRLKPALPDNLLALIRERGSLSSSEVQAATGLDPATLRGHFKILIDQGLVRTEGQRRGMRYLPTAKAAHAE